MTDYYLLLTAYRQKGTVRSLPPKPSGALRHGLGAIRPSRLSVLADFLHFCKLLTTYYLLLTHYY